MWNREWTQNQDEKKIKIKFRHKSGRRRNMYTMIFCVVVYFVQTFFHMGYESPMKPLGTPHLILAFSSPLGPSVMRHTVVLMSMCRRLHTLSLTHHPPTFCTQHTLYTTFLHFNIVFSNTPSHFPSVIVNFK